MTTLANDLIKAKALIAAPEDWCKGIDFGGCRLCAMYALSRAAPYDTSGGRWWAMNQALKAAVPRKFKSSDCHRVVAFNDADSTTHADVMAMFDRAIKRASKAAQNQEPPR